VPLKLAERNTCIGRRAKKFWKSSIWGMFVALINACEVLPKRPATYRKRGAAAEISD
jgi:hypothetical protein